MYWVMIYVESSNAKQELLSDLQLILSLSPIKVDQFSLLHI